MEVHSISVDDNEADTSQDEMEELEESLERANKRLINKDFISTPNDNEGSFSNLFKEWERPCEDGTLLYSSSPFEPQPEPFQFLFLDSISSVTGVKHKLINLGDDKVRDSRLHSVMRLFGVARAKSAGLESLEDVFEEDRTRDGGYSDRHSFSVCCNVHGYIPSFYALPTLEIRLDSEQFVIIRDLLERKLNEATVEIVLNNGIFRHVHEFVRERRQVIVKIEGRVVKDVENSIFLFPAISNGRSKESIVFQIYASLPMFIPAIARVLNELKLEVAGNDVSCRHYEFQAFENTLSNNTRFLTDQNIPGCTWLELKPGKYFRRTVNCSGPGLESESHCQIELDVHYKDIIKVADPPLHIPPIRILSFDIETRVDPEPAVTSSQPVAHNQVIQIGAVISSYCSVDNQIIGKAAFVLGTCAGLPDAKVLQFYDKKAPGNTTEENSLDCEVAMLNSFRDFVVQMDPDIITGYNVKNFDFHHLIGRVKELTSQFTEVDKFMFMGRLKNIKLATRPIANEHKRLYSHDKNLINVQGRVIMDMYPLFIRHDLGRKSQKLKDVSKRYLQKGEEKDDVKYTEINTLQDGNDLTRRRLAKYCVQDSYLPIKLMFVSMPDGRGGKNFIEYYFELSQLAGTILRYLVNKSKEYNQYFKRVRVQKNNGRVPYHPDSPKKTFISNGREIAVRPFTGVPLTTISNKPVAVRRKCSKMLFTDDIDE